MTSDWLEVPGEMAKLTAACGAPIGLQLAAGFAAIAADSAATAEGWLRWLLQPLPKLGLGLLGH